MKRTIILAFITGFISIVVPPTVSLCAEISWTSAINWAICLSAFFSIAGWAYQISRNTRTADTEQKSKFAEPLWTLYMFTAIFPTCSEPYSSPEKYIYWGILTLPFTVYTICLAQIERHYKRTKALKLIALTVFGYALLLILCLSFGPKL